MSHPARKPTQLLLACFAFVLFSSKISFAQNDQIKFERLTTENGLSSNIIYSIYQDSKGFLWFGTHEGLCRYDGYNFKIFYHDPSDASSLVGNQVASICEDGNGNIWTVTNEGVCMYDYRKNNFIPLKLGNTNTTDYGLLQIMKMNQDELLIFNPDWHDDQIQSLNIHTRQFKKIIFESHATHFGNNGGTQPLWKDRSGTIYFTGIDDTNNIDTAVICCYDEKKKLFKDVLKVPFINDRSHFNYIRQFLIGEQADYWIEESDGNLFHYIPSFKTAHQSKIEREEKKIKDLFLNQDKDKKLWMSTSKGVTIYDYQSGKLNPPQFSSLITALNKAEPLSFFQDRTGVIWVGSFNGLFKINSVVRGFNNITANVGSRPQLADNFVYGLHHSSKNKIWVSYWNNKIFKCSLVDLETKEIRDYSNENYFKEYRQIILKHLNPFSHESIDSLISRIQNANTPYEIFHEIHLYWDGLMDQLLAIDSSSHVPTAVDFAKQGDDYWLATGGAGLLRIQKSPAKTIRYTTSEKNSVNTNNLTCLLAENNGNLWIGTNGGGLNYYDRAKDLFSHYTTENGLAHNSVYNLIKDDKGRLWIGTGNGLSCFDPVTKKFENFFRSDGLVNSEFNRHSSCKLNDGTIVMGGMNGIDYFKPDSVLSETSESKVEIIDLKVFDKTIPVVSNFSLHHNENYITISFAAMDFRNAAANKFAYKLEGIDKQWNIANHNSVSYATLSPGHYHFLVKAATSNGEWSNKPAEIFFTIEKPWWLTWWFISLVGFVAATALYSIYRFRIYQLKKVFAVRTKISQDLHDEVGATLSGIVMYSHLVNRQVKENNIDKATHSLDLIQETATDMVNKLSDIVWVVDPKHDSLGQLLKKLEEFAFDITNAKNIQLKVSVCKEILQIKLPMQSRKNIYLVCKEAVNNAVKYSDCDLLELKAETTDHVIEFTVKDNGRGFDPAKIKKGNGIENMEARIKEIGAEIKFHSALNKGAEWKIIYHL